MSERKLTQGYTKKPTVRYYQYVPADHEKVHELKKGQVILGKYQHTFVEDNFQTHLIEETDVGNVTIKGCSSINEALNPGGVKIPRNTKVRITYLGKGKKNPKFPTRRPPFLFDIVAIDDDVTEEAPEVEDDTTPEDDDNTPF